MHALVSGATGFSGGFLVEALKKRGFAVSAVSERAQAAWIERIDLTSSAAWAAVIRRLRPDCVFHLSGVAHSTEASAYTRLNTLAAAALLDAIRSEGHIPRALLFVGSAAEYGNVPESALPVSEDFQSSPQTPYGKSKYAQTELALKAARSGLRVIVARPSNIIGPGMPDSSAIGSFARQLREIELGRHLPELLVGDLGTSRDFVDVRDVVDAYVDLAVHSAFSGVVNIASEQAVTLQSVLDQLITEFGLHVQVSVDPARLRQVDVAKFSANAQRLHRLLGERSLIPLPISLRDIVQHERATRI